MRPVATIAVAALLLLNLVLLYRLDRNDEPVAGAPGVARVGNTTTGFDATDALHDLRRTEIGVPGLSGGGSIGSSQRDEDRKPGGSRSTDTQTGSSSTTGSNTGDSSGSDTGGTSTDTGGGNSTGSDGEPTEDATTGGGGPGGGGDPDTGGGGGGDGSGGGDTGGGGGGGGG